MSISVNISLPNDHKISLSRAGAAGKGKAGRGEEAELAPCIATGFSAATHNSWAALSFNGFRGQSSNPIKEATHSLPIP